MTNPTAKDVAAIIAHSGEVVGRTKLQKTAAILELAGVGAGFRFSYHHYGPYSEELTAAADRAVLLGMMREDHRRANWGGGYSIYSAPHHADLSPVRAQLIDIAVGANPVALELAVTAAFVAKQEGVEDAWREVIERKPEKATPDNITTAKALYEKFRMVPGIEELPRLTS